MEVFDRSDISYLKNEVFNDEHQLKIMSHEYYKDKNPQHIKQLCVEHGLYCLPTIELIDFLIEEIGNDNLSKTIEIGAGHGSISWGLDIVATDSYMQERPDVKKLYESIQQAPVTCGNNVLRFDAEEAIRKYHPSVVIAAWVTHKYNPKQHYRGGNMWGVNEQWILNRVGKYIFIGNTNTHKHKPILDIKHRTIEPEWLVSRMFRTNGYRDVIWIWENEI